MDKFLKGFICASNELTGAPLRVKRLKMVKSAGMVEATLQKG